MICDSCLHNEVCGIEGCNEEALISCADYLSVDVLSKMTSEDKQLALNYIKNELPRPVPYTNSEEHTNECIRIQNAIYNLITELEGNNK